MTPAEVYELGRAAGAASLAQRPLSDEQKRRLRVLLRPPLRQAS